MSINSPIGIFDSGLGGLTVAKRVLEKLPHESIAYLGDEAHIPYGEKSPQEIRGYALGITDFLLRQNSKLVIMACNMSSATALDAARDTFPKTPIIGVIEAGARAAVQAALSGKNEKSGKIGVLATTGTVNTRAYTKTLQGLMPEAEVTQQACPRFVPLVEAGLCDSLEAEAAAREHVEPLLDAGCRTIILGCTHYPFLTNAIKKAAGNDIALIDPAEETAIEAANILLNTGTLNPQGTEPVCAYFTSDRPEKFAELGSRFLGSTICGVQKINWGLDLQEIRWQEKMAAQTTKSAR